MRPLKLNRDFTVTLTNCEFFPLEAEIKFIAQLDATVLFVTWLNPKAGGFERPLATGSVSGDQFEGLFEEELKTGEKFEFQVLVKSVDVGGRGLLIGSLRGTSDGPGGFVEAADTFVAEEDELK